MPQIIVRNATLTMLPPLPASRMDDPQARLTYVLAGNATFTVVNRETDKRFTFKVRQRFSNRPHFVSVLTGPDNTHDFEFIGTIFDGVRFEHSMRKGASISPESAAGQAWAWLWRRLSKLAPIEPAELYHMGRCGRCGRSLTVPESINSGLGPECLRRMA